MSTSLQDRKTAVVTEAIFQALVEHLEAGDADDVSMDDLARDAGLSRRTIYRYFPTRGDLLAAAGDWIRDELLALPIEIGDEGIVGSFQLAAKKLEQRPRLARALLHTATGRAVRSGYRSARAEAIRHALRQEVPGLARGELDRAAGVLSYLCSSSAWIAIQDDAGLGAHAAQAAVVWAIESLLAELRASVHTRPKGGAR
jgi:AcrR family transcriptional regulator